MKLLTLSLLVVGAFSAPSFAATASAQPSEPPAPQTLPLVKPLDTATSKKLDWHYDKVSTVEYVVTGVSIVGVIVANTAFSKTGEANWRGGILVDSPVMGFGRSESSEGRERAARASDYLLYTMSVWPFLDAGVALGRGAGETAFQMSMINAMSFSVNGLVTELFKGLVKRERPWVTNQCSSPEMQGDPSCRDTKSFLSGHSSIAFTGAGLVCAHHQALPLYGHPVADGAACAVALAAATATGALRVVSDKHYTSDVFAGAALGLASGYLLPKILHYGGIFRSTSEDHATKKHPTIAWSAAPMAMPGGAMMTVSGVVF